MMTQGQKLQELRRQNNLSQTELGECILGAKMPNSNRTYISKLETGAKIMTNNEIKAFSDFFNCDEGVFRRLPARAGEQAQVVVKNYDNPYINASKDEGQKAELEQVQKELETLKEHYAMLKDKYDVLVEQAKAYEKERQERKDYADKFVAVIKENQKLKDAIVKMTIRGLNDEYTD